LVLTIGKQTQFLCGCFLFFCGKITIAAALHPNFSEKQIVDGGKINAQLQR